MTVFVVHQGIKFEVDPVLGTRSEVQDHIQEQLMMCRFIERAWVDGDLESMPAARMTGAVRDDYPEDHGAKTARNYTVFPSERDEGLAYHPFINIRLADGTTLSILIEDSVELAILGD